MAAAGAAAMREATAEEWGAMLAGKSADVIAAALRACAEREREACAKLVEAEGECRHVDHVQGFCACQPKADAIRARNNR